MKGDFLRYLLFLIPFLCNAVFAADNSLKYNLSGSNNWVPYYIPNKATPGILGELIPMILAKADIQGIELKFPPKRTNQALEQGELDFDAVCSEWFPNQQVGPQFVLSKPLFTVNEYFVNLKGQTPSSPIAGDDIGTVLGYYYFDEALYQRVDFKSEKELVLALKKKRLKRILIGDLTANYWAKYHDVALHFEELHTQGLLRIRLNKQKQHLLPRLNSAIDALRDSGQLDAIVQKYTSLYSAEH